MQNHNDMMNHNLVGGQFMGQQQQSDYNNQQGFQMNQMFPTFQQQQSQGSEMYDQSQYQQYPQQQQQFQSQQQYSQYMSQMGNNSSNNNGTGNNNAGQNNIQMAQYMQNMPMGTNQFPPQQQQQQQQQFSQQQQSNQFGSQQYYTQNFFPTPNMYNQNNMNILQGQQSSTNSENQKQGQTSGGMNMQQIPNPQSVKPQNLSEEDKIVEQNLVQHIQNLRDKDKRENALNELSKIREVYPHLAPILWHSVGTIAILIQDIVSIYNQLYPPNITPQDSSRVCSVLGLLQCLALHPDTKVNFLNAHIPLFLYPFLNTNMKTKPYENLRVTSLGVIGALVKGDDTDAITFLMQTEIIPLCLRIMKRGQELSRTVATFIVQKILLDENGLLYICQTAERFFAISTVLQSMIEELIQSDKEDQRLLRHIIRCYLRLSENSRANEALQKCLPQILKEKNSKFITDEVVKRWHLSLLNNLGFQ